ncbi:MAG TPA: hypothetical protein VG868_09080, partial [Casimicrobiaceae bacterium]|nr:hypothetical protein [Casimicrobiaceae bacterium]
LQTAGGAMEAQQLKVGATLVVSTTDGDEEDEVTRVVIEDVAAGLCVVETMRNGRVIVMRGQRLSIAISQ